MTKPSGGSVDHSGSFPADHREVELGMNEQLVNDAVIQALAERGQIFDFGGALATVSTDNNDCSRRIIRRLPLPSLRELITDAVQFVTHERDLNTGHQKRRVHRVPRWCYEAIHKRGVWHGIPAIRGIVNAPVMKADGSILQKTGFDVASGLYVDLDGDFPEIPGRPTPAAIRQAVESLLGIVADFPFSNPASRSAWIAAVLTPLAREAHDGATGPLFLIDANTRGSGKSLLADLAALIVTGREATRLVAPACDDEFRKRITALVSDGARLVLIDNVGGKFGCESIDAALTGTVWKDRRLGATEMIEAPLRVSWLASGNNVALAADTARRTCHIRLESPLENPEDRAGFRHPDVRRYVRENRPALLAAALTILRGYVSAGRPDKKLKPWGSFESWSDLVRGAIVWSGMEDPGDTRFELRETADSEAGALRHLLGAIVEIDSDGIGLRTSDLLKIANGKDQSYGRSESDALREALEGFMELSIEKITARKLGSRLGHFRSRVVEGLKLDIRIKSGSGYWVIRSGDGGSVDHGGSFFSGLQKTETEWEDSTNAEEGPKGSTEIHRSTTGPDLDWLEDLKL